MSHHDEDKGRVKLAMLVREMRENVAAHIEIVQLNAKVTRSKYLALVAEGFTEQQALELCK